MKQFLTNPVSVGVISFLITMLVFFGAKAAGFYIEDDFSIVRGSTITLTNIEEDDHIILDDGERRNRVTATGVTSIRNIIPGNHTLLITRDGFWPWAKSIEVHENKSLTFSPFFVPKNANGVIISPNDSEYAKIKQTVISEAVPQKTSVKISKKGDVALWVENNEIFAEWLLQNVPPPEFFCDLSKRCENVVKVLSSQTTVRNLDFYKNRSDIIILASEIGVYALEIDRRGIQNFQPIYKGTSLPIFSTHTTDSLYVLDGTILFMIHI